MARVLLGGKVVDTNFMERVEIRTVSGIKFLYLEVLDVTNSNTGKQNLCVVEKQEDYNYIKNFMESCHDEYCSYDGMSTDMKSEMNMFGLYLTPFVNCSMMFDYFVNNCLFMVQSITDIYSKIESSL